ncbi:MAG: hypothetical protein AB7U83_03350 [Vicinamibacterales bacterium]
MPLRSRDLPGWSRGRVLGAAWLVVLAGAVGTGAQAPPQDDLDGTLALAAARVEEFFTRAASLVVNEHVYVQPLSFGLSGDGPGRSIESELRLSWTPGADGDGATEAQTLRLVTKVNGRRPRKNDPRNCTAPEQHDTETQVLSMLLPSQRGDYTWRLAGRGKVDGRTAIRIDYQEKAPLEVTDVRVVENNDDCISYNIEGGLRGRLWIDAESYDVLRMDQRLDGQAEVELPRNLHGRAGVNPIWTVQRMDTTFRFKRVRFADPEETLVLPVSSSSLRVTQGAGTPRLRVTTQYKGYRRFLTGGRLITEPKEQD